MDKNKIIEGAAKLVAKGAFDKAIREYQKVLDLDPRDVRVLQKMGELYQKKADNPQAASFFTRVAEVYAQDGFFLKAVALYKQVLKLNPDLVEVNVKLAELHQHLGLMTEAMAFFQVVVAHHERKGDSKATFATLKKMVDLDPENVSSRLKLAELYAREQMGGEALAEFKRAADWLERNNRPDERLRVLERIAALEPDNVQLARSLAHDYLARGDHKRALAKLQLCFKADPRDIPTLVLLAQAFTALNHTSKTLSVYKELAKLHAERNQHAESREAWGKIERIDPADPDLLAWKASQRAVAAVAQPAAPRAARTSVSQAIAAVQAAVPPPPPPPPPAPVTLSREQIHKLLAETDVYVKYGLHDKALEHLRRIFAVDPENLEAHEKAYVIYRSAGQGAQATEQLLNVLRLCTRGLERKRAQPYLDTLLSEAPGHPEMPAFLAVLRPESVRGGADPALMAAGGDEEVLLADDGLDVSSDDLALRNASPGGEDELLAEDDEAMLVDEPPEPVAADEPLAPRRGPGVLVPPPPGVDGYGDAMPYGDEGAERTEMNDALGAYESGVESEVELPPDEEVVLTPAPPPPPRPAPAAPPTGRSPASGTQSAFPRTAPAPATGARPVPAGTNGAAARTAPAPAPARVAARGAPEESGPVSEELNEAGFFLDQGLLDEAREVLDTVELVRPGLPRTAALRDRLAALEAAKAAQPSIPTPPPTPRAAPPGVEPIPVRTGSYNLAEELADELQELGPAPEEPEPAAGGDLQYSVEEVFSEFKKGLERVVQRSDVDTHYDLGIAYKEMGLLDDAIAVFDVARQGCQGQPKELDCLTMMGLLHGMRGEPQRAVAAFRDALAGPHAGPREVSLRYELGLAHEAAGAAGKALGQFLAVQKAEPGHRDVAERVRRLSATVRPEEDGPARPTAAGRPAPTRPSPPEPAPTVPAKTRKVGYL
ncbi:MAG TPA: tetratricopeptide repeat protein [Myxococcaceae bacterium]|nr:tetratricopeptide repeat protein [Myxococcaceae bacterium]